jgi:hypothetical protein
LILNKNLSIHLRHTSLVLAAVLACASSAMAATRYVAPVVPVVTPPAPPPPVTVVATTVTAPYVAPAVACGSGGSTSISRC